MLLERKRKITQGVAGAVVVGLMATLLTCCHAVSLPPVEAPLAPASPGTWFAPGDNAGEKGGTHKELGEIPPRSTGTHVTATLVRADGSRLIAVWGDPLLWEQRGETWQPASGFPALTGEPAEVTALSEDANTKQLVMTTRRNGSFIVQNGVWKPLPRPNVPYDANAQALGAYRGVLFVATLNDGLVLRDPQGMWQHLAPPLISTNAPRQFVVWRNNLYVRHGNGVVDCFDGRAWTRDVFTRLLPRRQVSVMASDGQTLFLAQWGGWSETRDGRTFVHRFPLDLKNVPLTALLILPNKLYVGTQGRGLAECDTTTGAVRGWQDERQGMGDDWITALAQTPTGNLVAGTFVSGVFRNTKNTVGAAQWQPVGETQKDCVTAIITAPDAVYFSLRRGGVRRYDREGNLSLVSPLQEAQCLFRDEANHLLWIGTRTGILTVSEEGAKTD